MAAEDDAGGSQWQVDAIVQGLLSTDDPNEAYSDLEKLGRGATAEIYRAIDTRTQEVVAIKQYRDAKGDDEWKDIAKEIEFLRNFQHEYIVPFKGSYIVDHTVWVILGYCAGSCLDIIELLKQPLKEEEIQAVCWQTLKALEYMHGQGVIHRDIKAGNILLTENGKVNLADFGASTDASKSDGKCNTFIGSPYWMSPEVITAMETGTYANSTDIWSLGISLIEMAEKKPPLFSMHAMSALFHIPQRDPPTLSDKHAWSSGFSDFLSKCLIKSEEERWTVPQLLKHPFVANLKGPTTTATIKGLVDRSQGAISQALDLSALDSVLDSAIAEEDESVVSEDSTSQNTTETTESNHKTENAEPSPDKFKTRAGSKYDKAHVLTVKYGMGIQKRKSEAALGLERAHLKSQMKELRRCRRKLEDALRVANKKNISEVESLQRTQSSELEFLHKTQEIATNNLDKEHRLESDRLAKAQEKERRKHEDSVKKMLSQRAKDFKTALKQRLSDLKKGNKKSGDNSTEGAAKLKNIKEKIEHDAEATFAMEQSAFERREMESLRAKQRITEEKLRFEHFQQDLDLQGEQLEVRVKTIVKQKSGPIHDMLREHTKALQHIRLEHQKKRHELEEKQMTVNHEIAQGSLQKRHTVYTKKTIQRLKKLNVDDEEIRSVYRRTMGETQMQSLKEAAGSVSDKKAARRLEKLEKSGLQAAKGRHLHDETVRLNKQTVQEMTNLENRQNEEIAQLKGYLKTQREMTIKGHEDEMEAVEEKIRDEIAAIEKYQKMEISNFMKGKDHAIKREIEKMDRFIMQQEDIVRKNIKAGEEAILDWPAYIAKLPSTQ